MIVVRVPDGIVITHAGADRNQLIGRPGMVISKRWFLTVHSRCYRRCEFYSGVLISSVKTSSVKRFANRQIETCEQLG